MNEKTTRSPRTRSGGHASRFLRPEDLRRLQGLEFAARLVVDGFFSGRHRSPLYDTSAEFADYRSYAPGDDVRALDWRACARTDRDYIRLFRKETDMACHVLLDTSHSMAFRGVPEEVIDYGGASGRFQTPSLPADVRRRGRGSVTRREPPVSRFEYGGYLTAALCYLMIRQGDRAALALGSARLETFVPPGGTFTHLYTLLSHLETRRPHGDTDLARTLREHFALAGRRGLLVVISDFLQDPDPLFQALSMYTHRGWRVLLFQTLTEMEMELPGGEGPLRYLDAEGPGFAEADPDALRTAYRAELDAFLQTLESQAKARRIHYMRIMTSTPYDRVLERYLSGRGRS